MTTLSERDVKAEARLTGQSALQAFKSDLPLGGDSPTREDEAAILVATLLRQHLAAPSDPSAARIRAYAVSLATESLGKAALDEGCTYDDHPSRSDVDILRRMAQRTELSGRVKLSAHLLESAAEISSGALDRGRVLSDRSRNARKQGQIDLAEAQAEELKRIGSRLSEGELTALAHLQLASLRQLKGNFSAFKSHLEEAARTATKSGMTRLRASAELGLGTHAALSGDQGTAVGYLWSAHRAVGGKGTVANGALVNLAHSLLLSGRPEEARKVAGLLLGTTPPLQSALPALGGHALASARLNDAEAVEWASSRVRQLAKTRHFAREVAEALMECSAALELVGKQPQSQVLRRRAESMIANFGFHDLTFSEVLSTIHGVPARQAFKGAGARAEREIAALDVPRFPAALVGA